MLSNAIIRSERSVYTIANPVHHSKSSFIIICNPVKPLKTYKICRNYTEYTSVFVCVLCALQRCVFRRCVALRSLRFFQPHPSAPRRSLYSERSLFSERSQPPLLPSVAPGSVRYLRRRTAFLCMVSGRITHLPAGGSSADQDPPDDADDLLFDVRRTPIPKQFF